MDPKNSLRFEVRAWKDRNDGKSHEAGLTRDLSIECVAVDYIGGYEG